MIDQADSHLFVVFGGTGDLMRRKLLPALYRLSKQGLLPDNFTVLGVAREDMDDQQYRSFGAEALQDVQDDVPDLLWSWCADRLYYVPIGIADAAAFERVHARIEEIERERALGSNRVFYLALPPGVVPATIAGLGNCGLSKSGDWTRIVVEKPFGRDLESARQLNTVIHEHFDESQVFRIDHYLGKETVQNLLVFRFANPVFESLWNRDRINSVQITVAESVGVGTRAGYYDRSGALRDMVQNHMSQLVTLTAMEAPSSFSADAIRNEKVKVLHSIAPIDTSDVVFGQYRSGQMGGETVAGYLDEQNVPQTSETETFVALRLQIANWRWQGVPFYLRTGKRMRRRETQIVINYKKPPISLFEPFNNSNIVPNALILTLQPDERFDLCFEVKKPGQGIALRTESLTFRYSEDFLVLPEGYETLLHDVMTDDQTLFVRADEAEEAWKLFGPLLGGSVPLRTYAAGEWGPRDADRLLAEKGDWWITQ